MKRFIFIFILALGVTTGCAFDQVVETYDYQENVYLSHEYEPLTDSTYVSWFVDIHGDRVSAEIPYIKISPDHVDYEVVKKDLDVMYWACSTDKEKGNTYEKDGMLFTDYIYQVKADFTNCDVCFLFVESVPLLSNNIFMTIKPEFYLEEYELVYIEDEKENDKEYYCGELRVVMKVEQKEHKYYVSKTIKIMQEKIPIEFDVTVDSWINGGQNNV